MERGHFGYQGKEGSKILKGIKEKWKTDYKIPEQLKYSKHFILDIALQILFAIQHSIQISRS
jgi:hypothetical protein